MAEKMSSVYLAKLVKCCKERLARKINDAARGYTWDEAAEPIDCFDLLKLIALARLGLPVFYAYMQHHSEPPPENFLAKIHYQGSEGDELKCEQFGMISGEHPNSPKRLARRLQIAASNVTSDNPDAIKDIVDIAKFLETL